MIDSHDISGAEEPLQFGVFSASAGRDPEFAALAFNSLKHGPERWRYSLSLTLLFGGPSVSPVPVIVNDSNIGLD